MIITMPSLLLCFSLTYLVNIIQLSPKRVYCFHFDMVVVYGNGGNNSLGPCAFSSLSLFWSFNLFLVLAVSWTVIESGF